MMAERLAEIRKRWSNGPNPMDDPPENEISDWLDMRDCLDHIAQLEAQRGGAVVVPDYPSVMVRQSVTEVARHAGVLEGVKWARENAKAIPADRVPDGMVGVDREERDLLDLLPIAARKFLDDPKGGDGDESFACDLGRIIDDLDAIRSAKGEVEG